MIRKYDYSLITEFPGLQATQEQLERLYQRYHFAKQFASEKDVLEVACGSGIGLGYLRESAKSVVGCDLDEKNVSIARKYYESKVDREDLEKIQIALMDAHELRFPNESFDLILLFEAIYYLKHPHKFIDEAKRILRENGKIVICSVNKDWEDFHPSPYTFKYFSVPELCELLKKRFKTVEMFGGFPIEKNGLKNKVISSIKRLAISFNLIPGNLKTRAYLKRIFMGKLSPLPQEVYEDMAPYKEPEPIITDKINKDYKIIYAVASK